MSMEDKIRKSGGGVKNAAIAAGIIASLSKPMQASGQNFDTKHKEIPQTEVSAKQEEPRNFDIQMSDRLKVVYDRESQGIDKTIFNSFPRKFKPLEQNTEEYKSAQDYKFANRMEDAVHADTLDYTNGGMKIGTYDLLQGDIRTAYVRLSDSQIDSLMTADPQKLNDINESNNPNSLSTQAKKIHEEAHATHDGRPEDSDNLSLSADNLGIYAPGCNPREMAVINIHDELVARMESMQAIVDTYNLSDKKEDKDLILSQMTSRYEDIKAQMIAGINLDTKEGKEVIVSWAENDYNKYKEQYTKQAEAVASHFMKDNNVLTIACDNKENTNARIYSMYSKVGHRDYSELVPQIDLSAKSIENIDYATVVKTGMYPEDVKDLRDKYNGLPAQEREKSFLNDAQEKAGIEKTSSQPKNNNDMTPFIMQAKDKGFSL